MTRLDFELEPKIKEFAFNEMKVDASHDYLHLIFFWIESFDSIQKKYQLRLNSTTKSPIAVENGIEIVGSSVI